MAVLKYRDSDGNYQEIVGINVQCEVVQTTGTSTTTVMSQNAVTNALSGKASESDLQTLQGVVQGKANSSDVYTKAQVDAKVAFSYNPSTKGTVFPTDTSIVEYDATTKGMIFH